MVEEGGLNRAPGAPVTVYLGLGSNLGDRSGNLLRAVELLAQELVVERVSSLYETEPWGYREQTRFLNAALCAVTRLSPLALLGLVQQVEQRLGRTPTFRYGPRSLDVDILFYGDRVLEIPRLTVPHPHLAQRAFVLVPLAEIAPGLCHPKLGNTVEQLLEQVEGREGIERCSVQGWPPRFVSARQ